MGWLLEVGIGIGISTCQQLLQKFEQRSYANGL
jgi:hypothetical protein